MVKTSEKTKEKFEIHVLTDMFLFFFLQALLNLWSMRVSTSAKEWNSFPKMKMENCPMQISRLFKIGHQTSFAYQKRKNSLYIMKKFFLKCFLLTIISSFFIFRAYGFKIGYEKTKRNGTVKPGFYTTIRQIERPGSPTDLLKFKPSFHDDRPTGLGIKVIFFLERARKRWFRFHIVHTFFSY